MLRPPGPPARPISLVVFDLGGVIVRICRSWGEACAAAGLPCREGAVAPDLIARRKTLRHAYERGEIACDAFFTGIAAAMDGLYTPDEFRQIHQAWTLDEYLGVGDLIDRVHAAGLATGVLSNTNHAHWQVLAPPSSAEPHAPLRYPAIAKVRHLHASHLLGHSKPDPEIYRAFEARTGFTAEQILFFDDMPENVEGARAAGWRAEQIDHTGDTAAQMHTYLRDYRVLIPTSPQPERPHRNGPGVKRAERARPQVEPHSGSHP